MWSFFYTQDITLLICLCKLPLFISTPHLGHAVLGFGIPLVALPPIAQTSLVLTLSRCPRSLVLAPPFKPAVLPVFIR